MIDKTTQYNVRLGKEKGNDISELGSRTQTDFWLQCFIFYLPYRLTSVAKFTRLFLWLYKNRGEILEATECQNMQNSVFSGCDLWIDTPTVTPIM